MFSSSLKPLVAVAVLFSATAGLMGCGGGSSGDDADVGPPPVRPVTGAEGRWAGRSSTGYDVLLTVLDSGENWGIYTRGPVIHGAFHGTSVAVGGQLRGSAALVDYERDGRVSTSVYSGSYIPQRQLEAGFVFDVFTAGYVASFGQAATTAAVAGNYLGRVGGWPTPLALTINADGGLISTQPTPACLVRGSIGPRAGGRGVYDLRASFTGDGCPLPHGTGVAGIGMLDGGRLSLVSVAPSLVDFFVFQGQR